MKFLVIKTETVTTTEIYETPEISTMGFPTMEDNAIGWTSRNPPMATQLSRSVKFDAIPKCGVVPKVEIP